jgi:dTDP-4-amino-4,6-dideoxygalactose transaminase
MSQQATRIRFNDVAAAYQEQRAEIDAAIARVLERGDFVGGTAIREFEESFARYCGVAHAIGASNGTTAIHLALAAAGVRPGDEVITSPMTFIATAEAISHAGARVVFADIHPDTLNLDPERVAERITPRTRAVVFVHLHGNPTGVLEVREIARRSGLAVIEDCAQAHGAWIEVMGRGRVNAGAFGDAGAFSFFPAKNIGAFGDAGAVVTDDAQAARTARLLANHGREEKYLHLIEGYNYRMDTLQAAVVTVKLRRLDVQVEARAAIAAVYARRLAHLPLHFQACQSGARNALHLMAVQTERRNELQAHLKARNIETGIHYPIPLHLQPAYERLGLKAGEYPNAERTAATTLSVPMYPQLPPDHAEQVCDAIVDFFRGR